VANHIGKQKRHVTSNAYDINKPLGEALAAPHKANKINQIGWMGSAHVCAEYIDAWCIYECGIPDSRM